MTRRGLTALVGALVLLGAGGCGSSADRAGGSSPAAAPGSSSAAAAPSGQVSTPPPATSPTATGPSADDTTATPATAVVEAGRAFLTGFVADDGRVVRHDQGGDTVSEGQAYAMLVAVGIGDADTFAAVWAWTQDELQRPDGLLSWRWADGQVADASSAADADLDAARALVLAGEEFGQPRYTSAGLAIGSAVLDLETVQTGAGRVLTAGQWATAEPYAYNPSYASPGATAVLAAASGDPRWAELDAGSRTVTAALLAAAPLPPDWAQVHADGTVEAMPGAVGRGQSVRYGYDAARTPIRFAESCDPADQALAAALVVPLDRGGDAAELDLGGTPLAAGQSVLAATAQAAAVAASGDPARAAAELAGSDAVAGTDTSYYGTAWAALGRLMLTDDALGGCPLVPAA